MGFVVVQGAGHASWGHGGGYAAGSAEADLGAGVGDGEACFECGLVDEAGAVEVGVVVVLGWVFDVVDEVLEVLGVGVVGGAGVIFQSAVVYDAAVAVEFVQASSGGIEAQGLGDGAVAFGFGELDGDVAEGVLADVEAGAGLWLLDEDLDLVGGVGVEVGAEAVHEFFGVFGGLFFHG